MEVLPPRVYSFFRLGIEEKFVRQTGDEHVLKGREPLQMGWYEFASTLVQGRTVLDVGCGSGEGLKLLSATARKAVGIDLDERLKREDLDIEIKSLTQVADKSFDVIVCIDVLEHIENDKEFVTQLVRIARKILFVSTPNYALSLNEWPYHVREYTPRRFEQLFLSYGNVRIFGGNSTGEIRKEIRRRSLYYFLNDLYCFKVTNSLAKILKRLLFTRIWAHQAVLVTIDSDSSA